MDPKTFAHIVIAGVEDWGHARPLCVFAARAVLLRDFQITLFTVPRVLERIKAEVARNFSTEEAERRKLIRVLAIDNAVEGPTTFADIMAAEHKRFIATFTSIYGQLVNEQPVTCAVTKEVFPPLPAPRVLIIDFMLGSIVRPVSRVEGHQAKILTFCSGMVSYMHLLFAPAVRGGQADFRDRVLSESQTSGRPVYEVADEMILLYTDKVWQMPGFPKMHHWEFDSQDIKYLVKGVAGSMWFSFHAAMTECDGLILTSSEAYEIQAIQAMRDWFADTNRAVWTVGPVLPSISSREAIAGEEASSPNFKDITSFLDTALESHGSKSVLYISFGSVFWPQKPDSIETFIDVVIEKKIPFIFSTGSPIAQLSDDFIAKVTKYGLGMLSRWSPQQTILSHPALGWFVTHGGQNSVLEAIFSGVPMICWPFGADQPANAVNLTDNHDVAYELLEIRNGNGLKPIYRTGKTPVGSLEAVRDEAHEVLDKAFGEDGARKRVNVLKLKEKMALALEKDGSSYQEMQLLLDAMQGEISSAVPLAKHKHIYDRRP